MRVDGRACWGGGNGKGLPQEAAEEVLTAGCLPSMEGKEHRGFAAAVTNDSTPGCAYIGALQ